ncbi:MAG: c-type cytochrome [Nitrospira sp. CR1.1]|jgi:mono/diheme cytochrome c family protein|nr:c-type cytochrome [Nitrospira sp. CR1.1]
MRTRGFVFGLILTLLLSTAASPAPADPGGTGPATKGDAARGQGLFNGKGICHYCHGIDGVIDKKPSLAPDTRAVIAKHAASAPDLRNRASQKLKDNKARFRAIREGHPGSGMFPDSTLNDQDISDIVAYLAALRQSATAPGKSPY